MSDTPKTDLIEAEYWDGDLNVRDVFERMGDMERELAVERTKVSLLRDALSFLVQNVESIIDGDCNAYTLTPAKEALAATTDVTTKENPQ